MSDFSCEGVSRAVLPEAFTAAHSRTLARRSDQSRARQQAVFRYVGQLLKLGT
jgi:hypothetical protein